MIGRLDSSPLSIMGSGIHLKLAEWGPRRRQECRTDTRVLGWRNGQHRSSSVPGCGNSGIVFFLRLARGLSQSAGHRRQDQSGSIHTNRVPHCRNRRANRRSDRKHPIFEAFKYRNHRYSEIANLASAQSWYSDDDLKALRIEAGNDKQSCGTVGTQAGRTSLKSLRGFRSTPRLDSCPCSMA